MVYQRSVFTPYDSIDLVEALLGALTYFTATYGPALIAPSILLLHAMCLKSPLVSLTLGGYCLYNLCQFY